MLRSSNWLHRATQVAGHRQVAFGSIGSIVAVPKSVSPCFGCGHCAAVCRTSAAPPPIASGIDPHPSGSPGPQADECSAVRDAHALKFVPCEFVFLENAEDWRGALRSEFEPVVRRGRVNGRPLAVNGLLASVAGISDGRGSSITRGSIGVVGGTGRAYAAASVENAGGSREDVLHSRTVNACWHWSWCGRNTGPARSR